jgi:hypothetical protein
MALSRKLRQEVSDDWEHDVTLTSTASEAPLQISTTPGSQDPDELIAARYRHGMAATGPWNGVANPPDHLNRSAGDGTRWTHPHTRHFHLDDRGRGKMRRWPPNAGRGGRPELLQDD